MAVESAATLCFGALDRRWFAIVIEILSQSIASASQTRLTMRIILTGSGVAPQDN